MATGFQISISSLPDFKIYHHQISTCRNTLVSPRWILSCHRVPCMLRCFRGPRESTAISYGRECFCAYQPAATAMSDTVLAGSGSVCAANSFVKRVTRVASRFYSCPCCLRIFVPQRVSSSATAKMMGWILREAAGTIPVDVGMMNPPRPRTLWPLLFPSVLLL